MTITIDIENRKGLMDIANSANLSPEEYLTARINDVLDSYDQQYIEKIKKQNEEFFNLAATLPQDKQEQLKQIVQELSGE